MLFGGNDVYTWCLQYEDGTCVTEYDEQRPDGRGFAEAAHEQVMLLSLHPLTPGLMGHGVSVPEGATPVFFRRRYLAIDPAGGESQPRATVHCIGWERGDGGDGCYLFIDEEGRVLLSWDRQAV